MRSISRRNRSADKVRALSRHRTFEALESRSLLAADVIITEIMYHPQSEDVREEYIEIYNREAATVDLSGWKFTKGVDFTFPPNTSIGPGQYMVVAADLTRFKSIHPAVGNVIGDWVGQLSNSGETIQLEDASGDRASGFTYADEGDWGTRRKVPGNISRGTNNGGWTWTAEHDGLDKSLELVNRSVTNDAGQNWAASLVGGGTPGAVNSVDLADSAPLIRDVIHSPAIPTSTDPVTITARVTDEATTGVSVALYYRDAVTSPGAFQQTAMLDDGLHGDGTAGDGVFGAMLAARSNDTVVEFYVGANDAANNARTWPAPTDAVGTQGANALYQVDNVATDPNLPYYRLILSGAELQTFTTMTAQSDAEMNLTFISVVGGETKVRYLSSVRYRGQGSRSAAQKNHRVNFAGDTPWNGLAAINLNAQYSYNQFIGQKMFELAGIPAEHPQQVKVRRNNINLSNNGSPQFGSYVQLEVVNADWAANHAPGDGGGNAYRAVDYRLTYDGTDENTYRTKLNKATNISEDDWTDIMALGRAFSVSQTPDNVFVATIEQTINVQQWLRWLAVNALLVNEENGLINGGVGEEYSLYHGEVDTRFVVIPHDMDNLLGGGDQAPGSTSRDLFEPAANAALGRLMNHASYKPYYFAHLKQLAETIFSPAQIDATLDNYLGNWVSASVLDSMKTFAHNRVTYVLSQIPPGTPTLSSPQDALRITEVMYNAKHGNDYDYIELRNTSQTTTINLEGVTLAGAVSYTFGDVDLAPNQFIVVAANELAFRARYGQVPTLAGEYFGNLNNSGEQILLQAGAPLFNTILDFTYSDLWLPATDSAGKSLVIINASEATSSWGSAEAWRESVQFGGSPGDDDVEPLGPNSVVVNEVLSHTDLAAGDRVEFRNLTASTASLAGYYISDDPSNRKKFKIPGGTTVAPGGYVVFSQSTSFGVPTPGNTVFSFSELGDEVYLTAPDGIITIDSIDFSAADVEVSFGRHVTSTGAVDYPAMSTTTFGAANAAPKTGPIVINEVMYNPIGTDATDIEFIELKNVSASAVQLFDPAHPANTWMFTEGVGYDFPSGVSIPAGGFALVLPFDPIADPSFAATFRTARGIPPGVSLYGPYIGSLDGAGEKVELRMPGSPEPDLTVPMIVVDRFTYDDMAPWPLEADGLGSSLSRRIPAAYANDPASWDASRPGGSPGRDNMVVLVGDVNSDGRVDLSDATFVQQHLGMASGATLATGDANGDGAVDRADAAAVARNFGRSITTGPGLSAASAVVARREPTQHVVRAESRRQRGALDAARRAAIDAALHELASDVDALATSRSRRGEFNDATRTNRGRVLSR